MRCGATPFGVLGDGREGMSERFTKGSDAGLTNSPARCKIVAIFSGIGGESCVADLLVQ